MVVVRADFADRQRLEEREAVRHVDIWIERVQVEERASAKALGLTCLRSSKEATVAGVDLVLLHCWCFRKCNRKLDQFFARLALFCYCCCSCC